MCARSWADPVRCGCRRAAPNTSRSFARLDALAPASFGPSAETCSLATSASRPGRSMPSTRWRQPWKERSPLAQTRQGCGRCCRTAFKGSRRRNPERGATGTLRHVRPASAAALRRSGPDGTTFSPSPYRPSVPCPSSRRLPSRPTCRSRLWRIPEQRRG